MPIIPEYLPMISFLEKHYEMSENFFWQSVVPLGRCQKLGTIGAMGISYLEKHFEISENFFWQSVVPLGRCQKFGTIWAIGWWKSSFLLALLAPSSGECISIIYKQFSSFSIISQVEVIFWVEIFIIYISAAGLAFILFSGTSRWGGASNGWKPKMDMQVVL